MCLSQILLGTMTILLQDYSLCCPSLFLNRGWAQMVIMLNIWGAIPPLHSSFSHHLNADKNWLYLWKSQVFLLSLIIPKTIQCQSLSPESDEASLRLYLSAPHTKWLSIMLSPAIQCQSWKATNHNELLLGSQSAVIHGWRSVSL